MASRRVTSILCAADPRGGGPALERLLEVAEQRDVDALAFVGDLGGEGVGAERLKRLFRMLGHAGRPAYWVPGPDDAPVGDYLREAHNIEVVFSFVRGVHGTLAYGPDGHVIFAGMGGEVSDDADAPRDEVQRLAYPRWEPEYRLKNLRELDEHQIVLLLSTPPAHKRHDARGSDVLAELVNTYRPRLVVSGGERGAELLGRSLVVAPGSLQDGHYAIADLYGRTAELQELGAAVV
ncbi:MAG TPA: metallophosphoesterase [Solirubrobacteraceae bacterium]